ncbi:cadherin-like beta sandwich domain-containing protein [Pontibacter sp. KCTC 32443]|nr:cadherin-like beta sandwich domain-containing protein [Pontibacter sp. KCTC 32443]
MKPILLCFLFLVPFISVAQNIVTIAGTTDNRYGYYYAGDGGPATSSALYNPNDIAIDAAGNLFIADWGNHRIRKVDTNGIITTIAGTGTGGFTGDGGLAINAQIYHPLGVAVDAAGNVYFSTGNMIRRIGTNGIISTIAGYGQGYSGDGGQAVNALFNTPWGLTFDKNGNLFVADYNNHRIRKISTNGVVTTVAGTGVRGFSGDGGQAVNAQFNNPVEIALDDAGNLYVSEYGNHRIRKVSTNGVITTVVGTGTSGYNGDGGLAINAQLYNPNGLAVHGSGILYIADSQNYRVRKVTTDGIITTLTGTGSAWSGSEEENVLAINAMVIRPNSVALDNRDNLYIVEEIRHRIRKVDNVVLSPDADLKSFTLSTGTLSPAFAAATTSYTASVANEITTVNITPTLSHTKATLTVNGTVSASGAAKSMSLNVGVNTLAIVVTAENGITKTYTLAITRAALPAPSIGTQPMNATVCPGISASFTVTANNAVSYQWQVFTTSWQNITNNTIYSGATTTKLTIANSTDLHNKQYRCVVTGNSSPEAITQAVTLSAADVTKPTAIAKNISVTLDANGAATITPEQVNNNSTDNCGIQNIALSKTSFSCENVGANTVTLTVTDKSGNTNTATATVTVQKAPQTITFNALAASTYGAAPITLNATTTSGVAITYTTEGPATVNGNILNITGAGEVKVTATQAGTGCYEAATPVTQTMQVEKATATITLNDLEQPENGQPRVVTATTTPAGLAVTITYNGVAEAPTLKGTYEVLATVNDPNYKGTATATLTIQAPTGLGDDLKELKGVSLYPNPTRDGKLYLELDNVIFKNSLLVEVYSVSGRLVRSMHIRRTAPTEIDLSSHAAGLYLVRVTNDKEVKTIKVHKQ